MPVLIAAGLNSGDGAHSAPTAHVGEPTLPSSGQVGSGDTAAHPHPTPLHHSLILQIPGDHTWAGEGCRMKYHFEKMASCNSAVLMLLLNRVARWVLCSGKKTGRTLDVRGGRCILPGLLRKEILFIVELKGRLPQCQSKSLPVTALAAGGPSHHGCGPLHTREVRPLVW